MSNPIRLTGLASGMDTDSIISQLMKIENMRVDKQYQAATKITYKVDAYKSVNSKLKDFRLKYFTALSGGMLNTNTYKAYNVAFQNNSNANSAVSISANSSAIKGSYSIGVYRLATSSSITCDKMGALEDGSRLGLDTDLKDIPGLEFTKVRVADVPKYDEKGQPVMVNGKQQYEPVYEDRLEIGIKVLNEDGSTKKDSDGNDIIRYYQANSNETLGAFINRVNSDKETGVVMRYSQITGQFTFESRETGEGQKFEILESRMGGADDPYAWENMSDEDKAKMPHGYYNDQSGDGILLDSSPDAPIIEAGKKDNFLDVIGFNHSDGSSGNDKLVEGQNSLAEINGVTITDTKNYITLDGITFTLNELTGDEVPKGTDVLDPAARDIRKLSEVKFNLVQNIDEPLKAIKGFVDGYNALIEELNSLLTEKTYRDYAPLTDAQRKEMSEKEITEWDEKAKSGVLRRDSTLQNLMDEFRSAFYTVVEGTGMSLSDIGINTTSDYASGGKIAIDESKLRKALEDNPDIVTHMFNNKSSSSDPAKAKSENGLIYRLQNSLNSYIKNNEANSLKMAEDQQTKAMEKWTDLAAKLSQIEEKYYMKFAAMESAMAKMQAQMASLSGFFQ